MNDKPRWGIIDLLLVYAGMVFFTLVLTSWGKDLLNNWLTPRGAKPGDLQIFLFSLAIQLVVTFALVLLAAVWVRGASLQSLGLRLSKPENWMRYGLLGGVLIGVVILMAGILIQQLHPQLPPQSFEQILRTAQNPREFLLLLLAGSIMAPLGEELFYRGMVYPVLRWHLGKGWGMVAAGLVFGAAHLDLWRGIPLALGGVFLCWVYEKSGSILVSALTHGVWNGLMAVLIYCSLTAG